MLRLLIDTSAWLDLAARRDGQKWIVPLRLLNFHGRLDLLVPSLVVAEFDRNRLRSEMAVTTSVMDRLRQLRRELRKYAGEQREHIWLDETAQHIPLVNAMAPQNFREIDQLLRAGTSVEPSDAEYAKAVQRGLDRRAPLPPTRTAWPTRCSSRSTPRSSQPSASSDVHAFATSNYRDFSTPNGDRRQPHPDLAELFDGARSRYVYQVEGLHSMLLDCFTATSSERSTKKLSS